MTDVHAGASSMKVAVGQFAAGSDKRANLGRISALSEEAARGGARLVVFPEGAMHAFGELTDDLAPAAEPLDGRFVSELSRLAVDGIDTRGHNPNQHLGRDRRRPLDLGHAQHLGTAEARDLHRAHS